MDAVVPSPDNLLLIFQFANHQALTVSLSNLLFSQNAARFLQLLRHLGPISFRWSHRFLPENNNVVWRLTLQCRAGSPKATALSRRESRPVISLLISFSKYLA